MYILKIYILYILSTQGLDRYLSILCKATSIRDVIAFPKTMEGRDLMSGAPAEISEEDKTLYHITELHDDMSKTKQKNEDVHNHSVLQIN